MPHAIALHQLLIAVDDRVWQIAGLPATDAGGLGNNTLYGGNGNDFLDGQLGKE